MKERLDVILVERGLFPSRERAKASVMAGIVYVDGQRCDIIVDRGCLEAMISAGRRRIGLFCGSGNNYLPYSDRRRLLVCFRGTWDNCRFSVCADEPAGRVVWAEITGQN